MNTNSNKDTVSLMKIVGNDFDIANSLTEEQLIAALVDAFAYLIDHDFQKLIQIMYKADVDQDKLKKLLEEAEGLSSAEVIAKAYVDRQKAKVATWEKYSPKS